MESTKQAESPVENPENKELPKEEYDALVIGGGIAGIEASSDLGDMGFKVLLIEKEPSIGGKMYLLSKVFPTLDCASCISTPKMSTAAHHPNITLLTNSVPDEIIKEYEGVFKVKILEKPKYVEDSLCTGCAQCQDVCPIIVPKELDYQLIGRKAAYIPFDTAVPKVAVIDIDHCIFCGQCERICPAEAVNFLQLPKIHNVKVGAIIPAMGFRLFPAELKKDYHYTEYNNVIHAMQMDRLLSPTRPYNAVLRPSDGKEPINIAYILCTGSRDHSIGNPLCSQICCMYSIKQAQLALGALPLADVTLYYMDIRAFGKGFEEFYQQAKNMGVIFIKGKVAKIEQMDNSDLNVWYEDVEGTGGLKKSVHDLVVLSVGLLPNPDLAVFDGVKLEMEDTGWIKIQDENINPTKTSVDGIFVAGCVSGPKDIPDSILDAASAASQCASYLLRTKHGKEFQKEEGDKSG